MSKFKAYAKITATAVKDSAVVTAKIIAVLAVTGYVLDGIAASAKAGREMRNA